MSSRFWQPQPSLSVTSGFRSRMSPVRLRRRCSGSVGMSVPLIARKPRLAVALTSWMTSSSEPVR